MNTPSFGEADKMNEMLSSSAVQINYDDVLLRRAPALLNKEVADASGYGELYHYVENYAKANEFRNTLIALPVVLCTSACEAGDITNRFSYAEDQLNAFRHCLSVCRMLIDLHLPLNRYEEDIMLAAALCHILPEIRSLDEAEKLIGRYDMASAVFDTSAIIYREDNMTTAELHSFYKRIPENKLALLITLADRGNIVEHLYGVSVFSARSYIYETRNYYIPMCIYAKEHYHELLGQISILMEKMRTLTEVSDILLSRFEARETELTAEILSMQEENATLKGIISALRSEEQ